MPINQDPSRDFNQRCADFGPELGSFLKQVWAAKMRINLNTFDDGMWNIYGLYSGTAQLARFRGSHLRSFVENLRLISHPLKISCQGLGVDLNDLNDSQVMTYGGTLWSDFFHVVHHYPSTPTVCRAYVHAADWQSSVRIMQVIIRQFATNKGMWEAKTAGPGSRRMDTIVAYFIDEGSRNELVTVLLKTAETHPNWFADSLPPLVKREGRGIGSAGEPPGLEVYKDGGARHSFGSFFSSLCWVALKTTPAVKTHKADGRHMLDNMLHILRLLEIQPNNPQSFPKKDKLEKWYLASIA